MKEAVIFRVRINQASDRAVLRRNFRLGAAPVFSVTGDDNGSFHRDSEPIELFVILAATIVHVDQRRGHIAINRVSVIGRQLLCALIRCGIAGNSRFLELGLELSWLNQFYDALFRRWE